MGFSGEVHRSNIEDFFLPCVVDALIGEDQCPQNDQHNSNPTDRLHVYVTYSALSDRAQLQSGMRIRMKRGRPVKSGRPRF